MLSSLVLIFTYTHFIVNGKKVLEFYLTNWFFFYILLIVINK